MSRRFKDILFLLAGVILGTTISLTTTLVFAHGGDTTKVHGCVLNTLLTVRIVGASTNCLGTETAVDWDQDALATIQAKQAPIVCTFHCWFSDYGNRFKGKDLSYAILQQLELNNIDLTSTNFNHAYIDGDFINSDLTDANFSFASYGGNATGANFTNADFTNATAPANFTTANLQSANFTNTDLSNAVFVDATNMNTATLTGVTWNNTICPDETNSDSHSNTCAGHLTP